MKDKDLKMSKCGNIHGVGQCMACENAELKEEIGRLKSQMRPMLEGALLANDSKENMAAERDALVDEVKTLQASLRDIRKDEVEVSCCREECPNPAVYDAPEDLCSHHWHQWWYEEMLDDYHTLGKHLSEARAEIKELKDIGQTLQDTCQHYEDRLADAQKKYDDSDI